ncbi:MAG TPA: hypothetical protein VNO18_18180 [Xanthobacteraceae bacterium]|jgi:hypothetical protein|nr:hypothetical protein [Xanthobacteraceae bacterium]
MEPIELFNLKDLGCCQRARGTTLERITLDADCEVPDRTVWLDLHSPTHAEDKLVERALGIAGADARGTAGVPPAGRRRETRIRPQAARLALMRSASAGFRCRRAVFKS